MKSDLHYHFIGIGGIGMSGIARLLLACGKTVSGSDLKETKIIQGLKEKGAYIFIGHRAENIAGASVVIYSSAIKADNPEIIAAKDKGILLIKRAQALAELMKEKTVVTVTGSHGKTTTTSLVSYLLLEAGLSPTVAIGGIIKDIGSNACLGRGEFFVAEADESDGSFLYYQPTYSIITNIDHEHLDYYQDFKNALLAYEEFLRKTLAQGCAFGCYDDPNLRAILKDYKNRYLFFGLDEAADIYPKNIKSEGLVCEFDCFFKGQIISRFFLALGGRHNISNALSVIALGLELKIDLAIIKKVLADYKGAARRLEVKFQDEKYLLIDDYAHHPTEIKATLAAVRNLGAKRIIVIFQPHRYTRTKLLLDEFAQSFDLADQLIITDIYPAGEPALEGVTKELLVDKIKKYSPDKKIDCLEKDRIRQHILKIVRSRDLVITLGAGDIVRTSDELAEEFGRKY